MSYNPSIQLKRFTATDIPELVSWVPDARFLLQFSGPTYHFATFAEQLQKDIEQMEAVGTPRMYKAISIGDQETIGHIQLMNINPAKKSAWLGRILVGAPNARGRGLGTSIVEAVLEIAFTELQLDEVGLSVYDFNHAAIRCYEKLGFQEFERSTTHQEKVDETWTTIKMRLRKEDRTCC